MTPSDPFEKLTPIEDRPDRRGSKDGNAVPSRSSCVLFAIVVLLLVVPWVWLFAGLLREAVGAINDAGL